MKDWEKLTAAVRVFGMEYIAELTNQLILADKKATGHLINSLSYELVEAANSLMFIVKAPMYLEVIDKGRRPGAKQPPTGPIRRWIDVRGIRPRGGDTTESAKNGLAFVIARSIGRKGIVATHVFEKTKKQLLQNKKDILIRAGSLDIKQQLRDIVKTI